MERKEKFHSSLEGSFKSEKNQSRHRNINKKHSLMDFSKQNSLEMCIPFLILELKAYSISYIKQQGRVEFDQTLLVKIEFELKF